MNPLKTPNPPERVRVRQGSKILNPTRPVLDPTRQPARVAGPVIIPTDSSSDVPAPAWPWLLEIMSRALPTGFGLARPGFGLGFSNKNGKFSLMVYYILNAFTVCLNINNLTVSSCRFIFQVRLTRPQTTSVYNKLLAVGHVQALVNLYISGRNIIFEKSDLPSDMTQFVVGEWWLQLLMSFEALSFYHICTRPLEKIYTK